MMNTTFYFFNFWDDFAVDLLDYQVLRPHIRWIGQIIVIFVCVFHYFHFHFYLFR